MTMQPFNTLFDSLPQSSHLFLTPKLAHLYGGDLTFPVCRPMHRPYTVASYVMSMDGIISYSDILGHEGGGEVAGFYEPDRFLVALLRTFGVRIFGAKTLAKEPKGTGTPENIYPENPGLFREQMKRKKMLSALLTTRFQIPHSADIFHDDTVENVIYTIPGASRMLEMAHQHPAVAIREFPRENFEESVLRDLKSQYAAEYVYIEGGSTVWGNFLRHGLIDEIFITTSPRIVGNSRAVGRPTSIQGVLFTPETSPQFELVSIKKSGDFLFQRYRRQA